MVMRRLSLDYLRTQRPHRWIGMGILLLGLVISAALVRQYRGIQSELSLLHTIEGLVTVEKKPASVAAGRALEEELKQVNATIHQLTLPWGEIFTAVEKAATRQVALLQMQPDAQQRLLRITAEAGSQDAMLEYVRRLGESRKLNNVHLLSHQVQAQDPRRPIQFTVLAAFGVAP